MINKQLFYSNNSFKAKEIPRKRLESNFLLRSRDQNNDTGTVRVGAIILSEFESCRVVD